MILILILVVMLTIYALSINGNIGIWEGAEFSLGLISLLLTVYIILSTLYTSYNNKILKAYYDNNPCYDGEIINERIIKHRAFHNDPIFGIYYNYDIAQLPLVKCDFNKVANPENEGY